MEEDGNAILIDTSRTAYRDKILAACKGKRIRLIVLTHGHVDHVQNAAALSRALNAPVAMHEADYGLIQNPMAQPLSADRLLGKFILVLSIRSLRRDKVEPFEPGPFLRDGDTLERYGVRATIIGLPGHTEGSIGILIGGDLFVGDALMNLVYPTRSLLYANRADMDRSAGAIGALQAATVHFGHGRSVMNRAW